MSPADRRDRPGQVEGIAREEGTGVEGTGVEGTGVGSPSPSFSAKSKKLKSWDPEQEPGMSLDGAFYRFCQGFDSRVLPEPPHRFKHSLSFQSKRVLKVG